MKRTSIALTIASAFALAAAASSCAFEVLPPGGLLDLVPEASGGTYADRIVVSWPSTSGADAYNVYACDVEVGVYEPINEAPVSALSFECRDVLPYFKYFFKIAAITDEGESPLSRSAIGWVSPAGLRVDEADGGLTLSWDAVPGVELYMLEIANSADGPFYQMTDAETGLVVADAEHPYDASYFGFAFDSAAERQSIGLRRPSSESWFRVRAMQVVDGETIRSLGGVVEWGNP